jgi:hypothetical protein
MEFLRSRKHDKPVPGEVELNTVQLSGNPTNSLLKKVSEATIGRALGNSSSPKAGDSGEGNRDSGLIVISIPE